ncbi:pyrroline-5-carboxylate reductase [Paraferrimonas sedimenticola]|uniref:Pyrroline-5-carboxylate reductase n=1 Tax=Paraferrimonas sedimenticola TaxID=375674 RepID=A0AA37W070_9GAMM|nr:pyrroline-5-carboxylate reductase [Paraferrimonas sedimenticola]GLP98096.1 pyrroline-5-carboxylate reductase [Paraferrimonas sedimenticola]
MTQASLTPTTEHRRIAFIGAGNMPRAIISGLVSSGYPADMIYASNPSQGKLDALAADFGINVNNHNHAVVQAAEVIVLSVKPQLMEKVCSDLASLDLSQKLILTIAAGVEAHKYAEYLQQEIKLIRTMPNTPAQLGLALTGLYSAQELSQADRDYATAAMKAIGEVVWLEREAELDNVIACAGSSVAYFFLFAEAMQNTAVDMGVKPEDARSMIQQAMLGAAQMLVHNSDTSAEQLRHNVTSKGGTTAAAINTFQEGGLEPLVDSAMKNCVKRAQEMAKLF